MARAGTTGVCALLLVLLAAAVAAQDGDAERVRRWSVGWEEGLTLRRELGVWDVSLSAGPDDWLTEGQVYRWDDAWPDSLQGQLTDGDSHHGESGYVRLGGGRLLTAWREFSLHGTLGGQFTWSNEQDSYTYYRGEPVADTRTVDSHEEAWRVDLGLRIAWRPVPFLGIQARLGLRLATATGTRNSLEYDASDDEWRSSEAPYKSTSFYDYGSYGTSSLEFFVWF